MTVFVLTLINHRSKGNTLTEVFSTMEKAVDRMKSIYSEAQKDLFFYRDYMEENQGLWSCGWTYRWGMEYISSYGTIVERDIQ